MAMGATLQIRMSSDLKTQVEELYRSMGTSFAEAVRIFAQQSLREGGMPVEQIQRYEIIYTETAAQDIEEKADYIAAQFCGPELAQNWYFRLKGDIQKNLAVCFH